MTSEFRNDLDHSPDQHAYRIPYHWCGSRFHRYVVDAGVARISAILRGRRVVEMGCGDGYVTSQMAKHAGRIHAFDLNERAIAFARLLVDQPHVSFEVGRANDVTRCAEALSGDVEVVASFEVIEHLSVSERDAFLGDARELLSSGGSLILSTPNAARGTGNPYHAHEFRPTEVAPMLERVGFRDVRVSGLYLQPPWRRLEHFADTVPFRTGFRALARAGANRPAACRTLLVTARAG